MCSPAHHPPLVPSASSALGWLVVAPLVLKSGVRVQQAEDGLGEDAEEEDAEGERADGAAGVPAASPDIAALKAEVELLKGMLPTSPTR